MQQVVAGDSFGANTATAGTVIQRLIQPKLGFLTRVSTLWATGAAAGQFVTAYRNLGKTTITAVGASGQAVIGIKGQPFATRNLAANDYLAVQETDIVRLYQYSSISSLNVTLTGNLTTGVAVGATVWFLGKAANTDVNLLTGLVHEEYNLGSSSQTKWNDPDNGFATSLRQFEPLLIQHNNITTAGSLDFCSFGYIKE